MEKAMPEIIEITDISDPALDPFARLTDAQLRSRQNAENGMFIAETEKVIEHALDAGCVPVAFLSERKHIAGKCAGLIDRIGDTPVYTADSEVLSLLTGYRLTRGVLCAMRRPALPDINTVCEGAKRIAVLDGTGDFSNIGAIFRSAAALGVDAVLVTPSCGDPLYRRSVRTSMGTVFQIPWTRLGEISSGLPGNGLEILRSMGFRTAALALSDDSISIDDPLLRSEEKLAIILGNEGQGLHPRTVSSCDYTVRIPMYRGVDSLNVAAAAAVAFYELCRR